MSCYFYVICVFCLLVVLVRLSVPVQVIDWKDSTPEWPDVLMGTLNPTHSLSPPARLCSWISRPGFFPSTTDPLVICVQVQHCLLV